MPINNPINIPNINSIFPRIVADDKDQIIASMSWLIDRDNYFRSITDKNFDGAKLLDSFLKSELAQSSSIGDGIVVLQLTSPFIHKPYKALAKLTSKTDWYADDGVHVDLIAVIISPCATVNAVDELNRDKGLHLQRLSRLTRFLLDPKIAQSLRVAETIDDMKQIINPDRLDILAA
jgi:mannitol/fructose-specific phosphotransferase system IIA component (Ntr-type)